MPAEAAPLTETTVAVAPVALRVSVDTLLKSLNEEQRTRAVFPFEAEERMSWHFVPQVRKGLRYDSLDKNQQALMMNVLKESLSATGYKKVESIRSLENVLREAERDTEGRTRNTGFYYLTIFGTPSDTGTWGLRYEGHHLSLNWVFVGGKVIASTPQFLGTNPAEVRSEGPLKGFRALAAEEDIARSLLASLKPEQKKTAIIEDKAPGDIITGARQKVERLEDQGITYTALDQAQKTLLLSLIGVHAEVQAPAVAKDRLDKIRKADLNAVRFVWIGGTERGQGHYYRIQGPTFLIEYDNTQNNANHIHTVWRDFHGDFGHDALAEHYQQSHTTTLSK